MVRNRLTQGVLVIAALGSAHRAFGCSITSLIAHGLYSFAEHGLGPLGTFSNSVRRRLALIAPWFAVRITTGDAS